MKFFGVVFIVTTSLVLLLKKEKESDPSESIEDNLTLGQTYKLVWQIINLPGVRKLAIFLLTCKVCNKLKQSQKKLFLNFKF